MTAENELAESEKPQAQRRAFPRYPVDCPATITLLSGAVPISGRLIDLSLGGCRVATTERATLGILVRVEVQFQLRGVAFRVVGVAAGTRTGKSFAIRFLDMPKRRYDELVEVVAEIAGAGKMPAHAQEKTNAAAPMSNALVPAPVPASISNSAVSLPSGLIDKRNRGEAVLQPADPSAVSQPSIATRRDRRSHNRHSVDTRVNLLLVKGGISMMGRILNLSQGGCRLRTDERFNVGIYVRVEAEFYLHGLPFRLAGVSQAILDKNTIGVRFLDMSERRREQLTELIVEINEAEQTGVAIEGSFDLTAKTHVDAGAGDTSQA